MKPWREVLAERGWTSEGPRKAFGVWQLKLETWRLTHDGETWDVMLVEGVDGGRFSVWRDGGGECFEELESTHADDQVAFAALMVKPIGPGRVTVGALLGVMV